MNTDFTKFINEKAQGEASTKGEALSGQMSEVAKETDEVGKDAKSASGVSGTAGLAGPTLTVAGRKLTMTREQLEQLMFMRDDVDFIADSKEALLVRTTPLAKVMLYTLMAFLVVVLLWVRWAKVDEVVRGAGQVVPVSQVQVIQNLEGGILAQIFVKEGESVKQGQLLAKLDATQFFSQYRENYSKYLTLLASVSRLQAEIDNSAKINFPSEVQKDKYLITRETQLFNSRKKDLQDTLGNLKKSRELVEHEISITRPLVKEGVVSKIELLRLEREANEIKTRIDDYENSFRAQTLGDFTKQKADLESLTEILRAFKDRAYRTELRSPANGIVKQIYVNTVGGVVKPAEPIMDIVPTEDKLIIEARVRPEDVGFLKVGQRANIKITAYDYAIYGELSGVVTNISADTSVDSNGRSFYEVKMRADKSYLGSKVGVFPIMPGMTASTDIITGKRTILTYLLNPIVRAKSKAMRER